MNMQAPSDRIRPISIEDEMRDSYISYAMSVIISRALPDVRDGLKPVQRRIVYAMREAGLVPGRARSKSSRVVGDTMAKYHPHGDQAIYDTMVRMAQDFSYRYPLVDGQGNFGSVDGDPPAAMRYTEARLSHIADALLVDIDKETVSFSPTYDEQNVQPDVFPSAFPNLLVNGSTGIAVGMATNIPPHNLGETIDACVAMIENPEITLREIMRILPGPDFPTGANICGRAGIRQAYETGRGQITVRATSSLESGQGNKESIIITEIPYMVNKSRLVATIADLVRDKKVEGIADIRDESDRDGMRIVIELKRGENHEVVLNQLYKHTNLQTTFGIILLALVDNRPVYCSLLELLRLYLDHRREVVVRRTRFDLAKAERRAHILEGLRKALDQIDAIINTIRSSANADIAKTALMDQYDFSQIQAEAILDMRLQRLTGLEREKIEEEYAQLVKDIEYFRKVLSTPQMVEDIVKKELLAVKDKFDDERRTRIVDDAADLDVEDLIAEENMVVTISHAGYIKRIATSTYRQQRRGGRGITAMQTKEEDFVQDIFIASTHSYMMFFTSTGRCHWQKVYEIPRGGRASRGKAIVNMLQLDPGETVRACVAVDEFDEKRFVFMATTNGVVKKTSLSAFGNPRRVGINAIEIDEGDQLLSVALTDGESEIFLATAHGKAIRFKESDVRPMGRTARGVAGGSLAEGDRVIGMVSTRPNSNATLLTVTENGYGKRTDVEQYRLIRRGGQGVINIITSDRNGGVVDVLEVVDEDELMIITQKGIAIRQPVAEIRAISRNTQGVRLIKLEEGDRVVAVAKVKEE